MIIDFFNVNLFVSMTLNNIWSSRKEKTWLILECIVWNLCPPPNRNILLATAPPWVDTRGPINVAISGGRTTAGEVRVCNRTVLDIWQRKNAEANSPPLLHRTQTVVRGGGSGSRDLRRDDRSRARKRDAGEIKR